MEGWFPMKRKLSGQEFAEIMVERLRRAGDQQRIEFRAEPFTLVADDGGEMRLDGPYAEYCESTRRQREDMLSRWVRMWFRGRVDLPTSFEDAKSDLLPVIRRRGSYECEMLEGRTPTPSQMLGEHFAASVCYDWPECRRHIDQRQLDAWGITLDDAMEVAKSNLAEMSREVGFRQACPGWWASPWHDNYDLARVLLPDLIQQCEVQGEPVAMLSHRNHLWITGSEDLAGLERTVSHVEPMLTNTRFLSGIPLILEREDWSPFVLPSEHPLSPRYRSLWHVTMGKDYLRQRELLKESGQYLFVAQVMHMRDDEGRIVTSCTWTDGVDTMLPVTESVGFVRINRDDPVARRAEVGVIGHADWGTVLEVVGHRMVAQGMYPERYRVDSGAFPTPEELARINGDGRFEELLRRNRNEQGA
jgi:hypothetical protein